MGRGMLWVHLYKKDYLLLQLLLPNLGSALSVANLRSSLGTRPAQSCQLALMHLICSLLNNLVDRQQLLKDYAMCLYFYMNHDLCSPWHAMQYGEFSGYQPRRMLCIATADLRTQRVPCRYLRQLDEEWEMVHRLTNLLHLICQEWILLRT